MKTHRKIRWPEVAATPEYLPLRYHLPITLGIAVAFHRGMMLPSIEGFTIQLVDMRDQGTAGLRRALAALAVAAAWLVVWQKHLLSRPGPGLVLVVACALPFVADAGWFRLPKPGWSAAAAMVVVTGGAAGLLAYRSADGDAAVLFFVALAAAVATVADPAISVPLCVLFVALPQLVNHLAGSDTPAMAAIGTGFAWVAGTAVRAQAKMSDELVTAQKAAARHKIAAERQQLAREFHDLVGHTLAVTMLHMNAVRMSLEDGEADEALESLDQAQRAGREAMREMRQTVTLLGNSSSDGPAAVLPHVRDLPELVAGYASAGLKVKLHADADLTAVPSDVGLAAYRIAQESLTNAAKHSPDAAASVTVRLGPAHLRLAVINDIAAPTRHFTALPSGGHGIASMTQRATLAGGAFSAGPADGQWRVEAVLPVGDQR